MSRNESSFAEMLERLRANDHEPATETLDRVLREALALKVLTEAAVERCDDAMGCSIELCLSGSGETWGVYLSPSLSASGAAGECSGSIGEALRSAADAVEKGQA